MTCFTLTFGRVSDISCNKEPPTFCLAGLGRNICCLYFLPLLLWLHLRFALTATITNTTCFCCSTLCCRFYCLFCFLSLAPTRSPDFLMAGVSTKSNFASISNLIYKFTSKDSSISSAISLFQKFDDSSSMISVSSSSEIYISSSTCFGA